MKAITIALLLAGSALADDGVQTLTNVKPLPHVNPVVLSPAQVQGGTLVATTLSRSSQAVFSDSDAEVDGYYLAGGTPMVGESYFFSDQVRAQDVLGDGTPVIRITGHDVSFIAAGGIADESFDLVVAYYSSVANPLTNPQGGSLAGVAYATIGPIDLSQDGVEYTAHLDLASTFGETGGLILPGRGVYIETYYCTAHSVSPGNCNTQLGLSGSYLSHSGVSPHWRVANSGDAPQMLFNAGQSDILFFMESGSNFCIPQISAGYNLGTSTVVTTLYSDTLHCPADFNDDGFVDIFDFNDFVTLFESGC